MKHMWTWVRMIHLLPLHSICFLSNCHLRRVARVEYSFAPLHTLLDLPFSDSYKCFRSVEDHEGLAVSDLVSVPVCHHIWLAWSLKLTLSPLSLSIKSSVIWSLVSLPLEAISSDGNVFAVSRRAWALGESERGWGSKRVQRWERERARERVDRGESALLDCSVSVVHARWRRRGGYPSSLCSLIGIAAIRWVFDQSLTFPTIVLLILFDNERRIDWIAPRYTAFHLFVKRIRMIISPTILWLTANPYVVYDSTNPSSDSISHLDSIPIPWSPPPPLKRVALLSLTRPFFFFFCIHLFASSNITTPSPSLSSDIPSRCTLLIGDPLNLPQLRVRIRLISVWNLLNMSFPSLEAQLQQGFEMHCSFCE